jgi:hypothetical protein
MSDLHDEIVAIVYKHLPGKHSQKRHGWRYGGGVASARQSMRGEKDPTERAEYRKRAGMSEPKKVERKPEKSSGIMGNSAAKFDPDKFDFEKSLDKYFEPMKGQTRSLKPGADPKASREHFGKMSRVRDTINSAHSFMYRGNVSAKKEIDSYVREGFKPVGGYKGIGLKLGKQDGSSLVVKHKPAMDYAKLIFGLGEFKL